MVDRYTKIVLTIIAVALTALAIEPYTVAPKRAFAFGEGVVDVRIRGIDEAADLRWEPIHVLCDDCRN
jgi:hypothetical protein